MTPQRRPWRDRALALILAGSMTLSLVPTGAIAEALTDVGVAPQAEAVAEKVEASAAASDGDASTSGDSPSSDSAEAIGGSASTGAATDGGASTGTSANASDATSGAGSTAAADAATPQQTADAAGAQQDQQKADSESAKDKDKDAESVPAAQSLSSSAKVYIQDSKDKNSTWSTKSGELKAGDTLWANVYDNYSSVADPGDWTYTWLAGPGKSSDAADYTEVVGHEQSLTVTDAMAGKYFICKVTADGADYYGPAKSYGEGVNVNYIPGPVLAAGQAQLYSVKLSNSSPSVGDTLTATAYTSYSTPVTDDVNVTYQWSCADSASSKFTAIEGATGSTLTLTDAYKDKYIKVEATAGVNTVEAKTSDKVMREGAVKLAGVELSASSTEIGATLTAKAYSGSSYNPSYVDDSQVTYTWRKYRGSSAPTSYTTWETIEGESGPTLTVGDDLEGCYVTVSANAGANDVTYGNYSDGYGLGPFKQAGAVDISAVSVVNAKDGNSVFTVGDTARARAREKGAASGVFVDASKLDYQWLVSTEKNGAYTELDGATSETLELTSDLEGKYLKCRVSSKIGSSEGENRTGYLVAAAGSINITKAALDASGKAEAGKPLTATATAATGDVTHDEHVAWSWYYGDSAGSCDTPIEGATGNVFTPSAKKYAGKYVQARANGGFGDEKTNAVAVVEAGSVELYGVTVSGQMSNGGVHVGDVLTAKATKGNAYTEVSSADAVHYQWQYADSKSTYDSAFQNIPGAADSATYVPTADMAGKYIRVIATSENAVKSTQKKDYYGTTSVDPVGPVARAGQYTLKSVSVKEGSATTLNVGAVLTPSIKIAGSSSWDEKDLPGDAALTVAWYASEDGSTWTPVADGVDAKTGALTLTDALVGKKLKLAASALDNTLEWQSAGKVNAEGTYDLLRVTVAPQMNGDSVHLVAGDTVSAMAQAVRADGSSSYGIDVTSEVELSWYAADSADAADDAWEKLDVAGPSIQVPDAAAGKYLKVVAASGDSAKGLVSANPVIEAGSLAAAVQKLNDASPHLTVAYSEDGGNLDDVLEAELAKLGFDDIDVRLTSASFSSTDQNATVGVSCANDETNGDVEFFFMDPNKYSGWNIDALRTANVSFELSRNGETVSYSPQKTAQIGWDEAKLQDLLDAAAEQVEIGYAAGDSADSVTGNLTLPWKAGSAKKLDVKWASSDPGVVSPDGYGYGDYTGKVTRSSSDRDVALTASIKYAGVTGTADHRVTVKGDPQKVAADTAKLQKAVDANFTYENVKYFGSDAVADKGGLTDDLQMPTTRTLGVDGKYYKVEYSASTDGVAFNGYKGTVYRPEPGDAPASTRIALTVTDKSNPEVTASKTLDYAIAPLDAADLDAELFLMEQAKAGYLDALLNGQDAGAVTGNMHAFQKAYLDADGKLAWSYDRDTTDAAAPGIVPVELPGYDDMGTQGWRLFKSSNEAVVQHENLVVSQPEYNTKVTISSRLSSEKYARYAERYPDNEKYAQLVDQDVSATVTVKGTRGVANPEVSATCSVIGVDDDGNQQTWAAAQSVTLKNGSTAADLSEQLFRSAGITADYGMGSWGWYLNAITSPFDAGRTLGYDAQTGRYWQLFINGKASEVGAGGYTLEEGDSVIWAYSKYGDDAPTDELSVSCEVVGVDAGGNRQTWAQPTELAVKEGSTAADLSEQLFAQAGIGADTGTGSYGWYLNSLTSPFDAGNVLGTKQDASGNWTYWQLFINGEYAQVGAGAYTLKAGDKVSWVYGSDGVMPGQAKATLQIIGIDANGNAQTWAPAASYTMVDAATVADATELALRQNGIAADYGTSTWGWFLNSITSPFNGQTLAWDASTGAYWQLFIDGKSSSLGAGSVKLSDAKSIAWVYTAGSDLPGSGTFTTDPNAPKSSFGSAWPAFGSGQANGATVEAPTPSEAAQPAWSAPADIKGDGLGVSDPLIIDGNICVVKNDRIVLLDSQDGSKELASCPTGANIGYFCRPAYKDGYLVVPMEDGSLGIFVLNKKDGQYSIACRYKTAGLGIEKSQALTSVTISNGKAYAGFAVPGGSEGALACVDLATGEVNWSTDRKKSETGQDEGYYWAGAVASGNDIIIGNESGKVALIDGATGSELSSVSVGTPVRSGVVAMDASENGDGLYLAVSRDDGTLYKIRRTGDELALVGGGVSFAATSTSTPAVSGGLAFVCGMDADGYGTLSVIDLATMKVRKTVRADKGASQSAPLVSVRGGETYVYFTCNALPGGVYAYKLGDDSAHMIFSPGEKYRDYCTASVICDERGNLYYANDSGYLFKLQGAPSWAVSFDPQNGEYVSPKYAAKGTAVGEPTVPVRAGYRFLGWYTADGAKWDFSKPVTSNMTLYAKWEKVASPAPSPNPNPSPEPRKLVDLGLSGNGDGNGSKRGKKALAIALSSNASAEETAEAAEHDSLLAGFASGEATGTSSAATGADTGATTAVSEEKASRSLPIWPFIGMGVGLVVLVLALVLKRRKDGEQ